jgi:hypothetical protein
VNNALLGREPDGYFREDVAQLLVDTEYGICKGASTTTRKVARS